MQSPNSEDFEANSEDLNPNKNTSPHKRSIQEVNGSKAPFKKYGAKPQQPRLRSQQRRLKAQQEHLAPQKVYLRNEGAEGPF